MAMDNLVSGLQSNGYTEYAAVKASSSRVTASDSETKTDKVTTAAASVTEEKEEAGAVYVKSEASAKDAKAPYSINKMSAEDRAAIVKQMKQDMLDRQQQLAQLVQDMLSKQAGKVKLASLFSPENMKDVTAEDIAKAKADIAEDGYYGVAQTSQRLFDFASALAGDDVEKMKKMQDAMLKGFKEATKAWGEKLPEISQKTLDAANKLFDDYYASKNTANTVVEE